LEPDIIYQTLKAFNYINERIDEIKKILVKHKKKGWKLGSGKSEIAERKFKELLEGAKNAIESALWYGKGFAIRAECGVEVDVEFHQLIGLVIEKFNGISLRLAPEKLDDVFAGYLKAQLEILRESAGHFWDIQEIRNSDSEKQKKVGTIIGNLRPRLFDFERSMEPYLEKTEMQSVVEDYLKKTHS
jgi:hypothetical protein